RRYVDDPEAGQLPGKNPTTASRTVWPENLDRPGHRASQPNRVSDTSTEDPASSTSSRSIRRGEFHPPGRSRTPSKSTKRELRAPAHYRRFCPIGRSPPRTPARPKPSPPARSPSTFLPGRLPPEPDRPASLGCRRGRPWATWPPSQWNKQGRERNRDAASFSAWAAGPPDEPCGPSSARSPSAAPTPPHRKVGPSRRSLAAAPRRRVTW